MCRNLKFLHVTEFFSTDTVRESVTNIRYGWAQQPSGCRGHPLWHPGRLRSVYGLFADLLPAALHQQGGELEWGRARQGKVPDLKLMLDTPEGPEQSLAELKFVSAGKTWYPRGQAGKGTDRRAALIQGQYETTLRAYDVRFHGAEPWRRGQADTLILAY